MKRNNLLHALLWAAFLAFALTSCSDLENDITNDIEVLWEKFIDKGCHNNAIPPYGSSSDYNVGIGKNIDKMYYKRYKSFGAQTTSYVVSEENNSLKLDFDFSNLIKDIKTDEIFLIDRKYGTGMLYEVSQTNFTRGIKLAESDLLYIGGGIKIYNEQLYLVEKEDNEHELVSYNLDMSERKVIYSFGANSDEWVELVSLYEYDGNVYGTFQLTNAEVPQDYDPILIQIDVDKGEFLWRTTVQQHQYKIHHLDEEIFVFTPGEESKIIDLLSGEERMFSTSLNEKNAIDIYKNIVVVRDQQNNSPGSQVQLFIGYDLQTESELFSVEGQFLAISGNKVYSIDSDYILHIKSLDDTPRSDRIDLKEFREVGKNYNYWQMVNGSNLLLGQYDQCNTSTIILLQLP